MKFIPKILLSSAVILNTAQAINFNFDVMPAAVAEAQAMALEGPDANVRDMFVFACNAVDRRALAEKIKADPKKYVEESTRLGWDLSVFDNILTAFKNSQHTGDDKKVIDFYEAERDKALQKQVEKCELFCKQVHELGGIPFTYPLESFVMFLQNKGELYVHCGRTKESVLEEIGSESVRQKFFEIFTKTGFISAEELEAAAKETSEDRTKKFFAQNPQVRTLVIGGAHVGCRLTDLPYDENTDRFVVDMDPRCGGDVADRLHKVLPHVPESQFDLIVDESNHGGVILTEGEGIVDLLKRVLLPNAKVIGGERAGVVEAAKTLLTSDEFEGVYVPVIRMSACGHFIREYCQNLIKSNEFKALWDFLGAEVAASVKKKVEEAGVTIIFDDGMSEAGRLSLVRAINEESSLDEQAEKLLAKIPNGLYENDKIVDGKLYTLESFVYKGPKPSVE